MGQISSEQPYSQIGNGSDTTQQKIESNGLNPRRILGTRSGERFPAAKAFTSTIRSITAGIASAGSAIKKVVWSAYHFVVGAPKVEPVNEDRVVVGAPKVEPVNEDRVVVGAPKVEPVNEEESLSPLLADIQNEYQTKFNITASTPEDTTALSTNITHKWSKSSDKDDLKLPKISEQFYLDVHRNICFLSENDTESSEKKELLYERANTDTDNLVTTEEEDRKLAAARKLVDFVKDEEKASTISRFINQETLIPVATIMDKSASTIEGDNGPFRVKGRALFGNKQSFTLSRILKEKEDIGDFVLHCEQLQNPFGFMLENSGKIDIHLDSKKSSVDFTYDITFHFDSNKKAQIKLGSMNYNCCLVKDPNG